MTTIGTFEITLEPQKDESAPAGRMTIDKTYIGGLVGKGIGQMISKRTEGGTAVYYAIEEFSGSVDGKTGSFTLAHKGNMDKNSQILEILIVQGSGSGDLKNISGSMSITQENSVHSYELKYSL